MRTCIVVALVCFGKHWVDGALPSTSFRSSLRAICKSTFFHNCCGVTFWFTFQRWALLKMFLPVSGKNIRTHYHQRPADVYFHNFFFAEGQETTSINLDFWVITIPLCKGTCNRVQLPPCPLKPSCLPVSCRVLKYNLPSWPTANIRSTKKRGFAFKKYAWHKGCANIRHYKPPPQIQITNTAEF